MKGLSVNPESHMRYMDYFTGSMYVIFEMYKFGRWQQQYIKKTADSSGWRL